MRSRATNYLQVTVLVTGIIYIIIGAMFYFAPLGVIKFFAEMVSENWIDMIRDSELVAPLYNITRGLAALLFTSGLAMMLPLFDPLKYRGLIYFNGVIFPFLVILAGFTQSGILTFGRSHETGNFAILFYLFCIFIAVFMLNLSGLIATKKQAKAGIE